MPEGNFTSITVSKTFYNNLKKYLKDNKYELGRIGIKKVSQLTERSIYEFMERNSYKKSNGD